MIRLDSKEIKLKLFQTIQTNLATIGFTPNQQQNSTNQQLNFSQIICIFLYSINAISFCVYIACMASSVESYMNASFSLTAIVGVEIAFTSIIFKNDKLFNTIQLISEEMNHRSKRNQVARVMYEKTNRLVEKLSKIIYFVAVKLGLPGLVLPKAIYSYFIYFTTHSGHDAFHLPFEGIVPFDWNNPIGYFIAVVYQAVLTLPILGFLACLVSLALGCFLFSLSVAYDWKRDLQKLDQMVKNKECKADIIDQVIEFVRTHSNVKQLINDFADVYEFCILADVVNCTIASSVIVMMFQVEIISKDIIDPVLLFKSILYGLFVFGLAFFSCEIGQRLTNRLDESAHDFEQLDWYLFPTEIQRMLPIVLVGVQIPIVIKCFGIIAASRDQFKKMITIVYKSFNVLRKIFN